MTSPRWLCRCNDDADDDADDGVVFPLSLSLSLPLSLSLSSALFSPLPSALFSPLRALLRRTRCGSSTARYVDYVRPTAKTKRKKSLNQPEFTQPLEKRRFMIDDG